MLKLTKWAVAVSCAVLVCGGAQAVTISVNPAQPTDRDVTGPTGAPGYVANVWENEHNNGGSLTTAGMTVYTKNPGNNNWSVESLSGQAYNLFYYVSGLVNYKDVPFPAYDLVVYALPDGIRFGPQTASVTVSTATIWNGDPSVFFPATQLGQVNLAWDSGQQPSDFNVYEASAGLTAPNGTNTIIFRGLTAQVVQIAGPIAGVQFVEIPEPASLSLLALGGLGLLWRRRR